MSLLQLCLSFGLTSAQSAAHLAATVDYNTIDYDHPSNGLTRNATLTDQDGKTEATWTSDPNGELVTEVQPVTDEVFRMLWYGIAASLDGGGVFWACLVTDPTRLMDAAAVHITSIVQVGGGRVQHRTFMIPIDEADLAFTNWRTELTTTVRPQVRAPGLNIRAKELTAA